MAKPTKKAESAPASKAPKTEKKAEPKAAEKKAEAKAPAPAPSAPAARVAPPPAPSQRSIAVKRHSAFRRKLVGRVTSNKMQKTVVVEVIRNAVDPVYKKYVKQRARYKAHDEANQYQVGDRVEIEEHAPMSREKRWLVTRLIERPAVG